LLTYEFMVRVPTEIIRKKLGSGKAEGLFQELKKQFLIQRIKQFKVAVGADNL